MISGRAPSCCIFFARALFFYFPSSLSSLSGSLWQNKHYLAHNGQTTTIHCKHKCTAVVVLFFFAERTVGFFLHQNHTLRVGGGQEGKQKCDKKHVWSEGVRSDSTVSHTQCMRVGGSSDPVRWRLLAGAQQQKWRVVWICDEVK